MTPTIVSHPVTWILALAAIAAGGCSSPTDPGSPESHRADTIEARLASGIVFITMRISPNATMDALFEGRVMADEQGCLRLDDADGHTVVWPKGYELAMAGETVRILDPDGGLVGRVGDDFHLAGGEVTTLHDGLGFTEADRELAESLCPGRYWIVG